jgi:hypothetical protein
MGEHEGSGASASGAEQMLPFSGARPSSTEPTIPSSSTRRGAGYRYGDSALAGVGPDGSISLLERE